MIAFINNDFVAYKDAFLHVSDLSVQRGYGIFDFFKISGGHVYFLKDYMDRFYRSASVMRLEVPLDRNDFVNVVHKLIEKNAMKESGMKIILTGGYSDDGFVPQKPNLVIIQQSLTLPSRQILESGVKIITHEYVRDLPHVKTINYTMGIWLIEKMKNYNAYDVLYSKDGIVSEFPRSNFFIVDKNDTVVTPANNILSGVTRKNIMALAERHFNLEVRDLTLKETYDAKEAFITSTTKRIVPVVDIDGKKIGDGKPGRVSLTLYDKLVELEKLDVGS